MVTEPHWSTTRTVVTAVVFFVAEAAVLVAGLLAMFLLEGHYDRVAEAHGMYGGGEEQSKAMAIAFPLTLLALVVVPFIVYRLLRPRTRPTTGDSRRRRATGSCPDVARRAPHGEADS